MGKNYEYFTEADDIVSKPPKDEAEDKKIAAAAPAPVDVREKEKVGVDDKGSGKGSVKPAVKTSRKSKEEVPSYDMVRLYCSNRGQKVYNILKMLSHTIDGENLSMSDIIEKAGEEYFSNHYPAFYRQMKRENKF